MKIIRTKSGKRGWQCRLRENYNSFEEFKAYSEVFGLHVRLGYKSCESAWKHNPIIQGSVSPSDFRRVRG